MRIEDTVSRFKILIRYAINRGIAESQRDFGRLMGYSNESSFSQVINAKVALPKDFMQKLQSLIPNLNPDWLQTGDGQMIIEEADTIQIADGVAGDNSQVHGDSNTINSSDLLMQALKEIAAQRALVEKVIAINQSQSDALVAVMRKAELFKLSLNGNS